MASILITGASGLIGSHLQKYLRNKNFRVLTLSRTVSNNNNSYYWDIKKKFIEEDAIKNADYIIHLAGAGIADKHWTRARKKEIIKSRTESTKLLISAIKKHKPNLKGFIAASGIGAYGVKTSDKIFTEDDSYGKDFAAAVCRLWEFESLKCMDLYIRTIIFRIGVVYAKQGGAFEKMQKPIRYGLGAALGNGKQYMPWIHIDDLCELFHKAISDSEVKGIYNAVAPEHITNQEITQELANSLNKKLWLPNVPSFVIKLLFGQMASILLKGNKVSSEKIISSGFQFKYDKLVKCLERGSS